MTSILQSLHSDPVKIPVTFLPLGGTPQKHHLSFNSSESITWTSIRKQLKIEHVDLQDPNVNIKILNITSGKFKAPTTDVEVRKLLQEHTYIKLAKKRASKKLSSSTELNTAQNSPRSEQSSIPSSPQTFEVQELSSYQNEQLPVSTRSTRVPSVASARERSESTELGSYNNAVLPEAKPRAPTHHEIRHPPHKTHTEQTPISESSYNNVPPTIDSKHNNVSTPAQLIFDSSYNNDFVPPAQSTQPIQDSSYNNEPYVEPQEKLAPQEIDNSYGNVQEVRRSSSADHQPPEQSSTQRSLTHSDSNSSLYGNAPEVVATETHNPRVAHRSQSEVLSSKSTTEDVLLRNSYASTSSDHINKHSKLTQSSPANPSSSKKPAQEDALLRNSYASTSVAKQTTSPKSGSKQTTLSPKSASKQTTSAPPKSAYATSASQIQTASSPNVHRKLRERTPTKYTDIEGTNEEQQPAPSEATEDHPTCYASATCFEECNEEEKPSQRIRTLQPAVINHALYDFVDEVASLYIRKVDVAPSEPTKPKILAKSASKKKLDKYDDDSEEDHEKIHKEMVLLSTGRDWNAEYQALVDRAMASGSSCEALEDGNLWGKYYRIAQEFSDTANLYAKIIISEMCLPLEQRTIKPVDVGGVAGGQKYIFHNILFKFALDSMVFNDPPMWMYGGANGPDDEHAVKAAKNELKGLEAYSTVYGIKLNFPMMAVIDYKGFRLVAMSVLPVSKQTIKYGSNDSGVTIHADIPEINEKMESVATKLNLKGHVTGLRRENKKVVYGPGDIEAHLGTDGRHYVLDFGRVFPPEDPSYRNDPNKRSVFYNLLRPELVESFSKPLCSDAFTSWNSDDDPNERALNNAEVSEATFSLYNEVIPQFAGELSSNAGTVHRVARALSSKKIAVEEARFLLDLVGAQALHQRGISLRHLGEIRYHTTEPNMRKLLLSVCVGRVIKDQLRQTMRDKMKKAQVPSDEPFRRAIVKCLNTLLGRTKQGINFWEELLPNNLENKYPRCFSEDEVEGLSQGTWDLQSSVDLRLSLTLMMEVAGIKLKNNAVREMLSSIEDFKLVTADIKSLDSKIKHRSMIYMSGGMTILAQTQRMIQKSKPGEVKAEIERQLQLALHQFQTAHRASPSCPLIMFNWGKTAKINANYALRKATVDPDEVYQRVYDVLDASIMTIPKHLQLYSRTLREHVRALQKSEIPNQERIRGLLALAEEKETLISEADDDSDRCFLSDRQDAPKHF